VKISIISTPREIKHTCKCSRDGSEFNVTRPGAGVQFPPYTSEVSLLQRGQTGSEAHPTPELTDKAWRFSPRVRSPGVKSTSHPQHLKSRICICVVINLRPFMPSRPASEFDGSFVFEWGNVGWIVQDPIISTKCLGTFCGVKLRSVISGFRREVDVNCALPRCYAASSGNFLRWNFLRWK
jgi:hypothetical protein